MKNLFIALLVLVGGVAFAPKAEAGQYAKVWNGHCYTYVHKSQVYGTNWDHPSRYRTSHYRPSHYRPSHYRPSYRRPARVYYSQPVRSYRDYGYCAPTHSYRGGSRFAVSFGF